MIVVGTRFYLAILELDDSKTVRIRFTNSLCLGAVDCHGFAPESVCVVNQADFVLIKELDGCVGLEAIDDVVCGVGIPFEKSTGCLGAMKPWQCVVENVDMRREWNDLYIRPVPMFVTGHLVVAKIHHIGGS